MPNHPHIPNATYFITQITANRAPLLLNAQNAELLLDNLRRVRVQQSFKMRAYTIMPDHFHLLLTPYAGVKIDLIMRSLKAGFTREFKKLNAITGVLYVWQQDYWDHVIRDEHDFNHHLNYIHYNSVAHGYSRIPEDWNFSSYGTWKQRGAYPDRWGWSLEGVFGADAAVSAALAFE